MRTPKGQLEIRKGLTLFSYKLQKNKNYYLITADFMVEDIIGENKMLTMLLSLKECFQKSSRVQRAFTIKQRCNRMEVASKVFSRDRGWWKKQGEKWRFSFANQKCTCVKLSQYEPQTRDLVVK